MWYMLVDQSVDIRHLVLSIWKGKSPLSENSNLFSLVLVRWDKYQHWSPWNTILLTRDEAEAHDKLEDVWQVHKFKKKTNFKTIAVLWS